VQDSLKFTQILIFGLKTNHLATLEYCKIKSGKLGRETPSQIRVRSLICNTKNFYLRILPCGCEVRGHYMCKEMPVIPIDMVMDEKIIVRNCGGPRRRRGTRGRWPQKDQIRQTPGLALRFILTKSSAPKFYFPLYPRAVPVCC
jgi:hypothetical protein